MTYTEALPMLKALDHKDKIRAIQFLANEVAVEEGVFFVDQKHEFISQTDAFSASNQLQMLLDERKANAIN